MLLYFNSLKAKQAMKKSTEESSAVQKPQAGKMHEIDLESLLRDVSSACGRNIYGHSPSGLILLSLK